MPRKPREEVAGGIFHVYARGNDKRLIYRDDVDREVYLRLLAGTVGRCRWRLLGYCLMENHVHLVIETPDANLGVGMQWFHSGYALQFNQRHGRSGHVFQGRYGAVRVKSDAQLWAVAAYVAMNPVEAGLCDAPGEWAWSSHAATVSGRGPGWLDVGRLLGFFGAAGGDPRERYAAMFQEMREARPLAGRASLEGNSVVDSPGGATGGAAPSR
jgi:putative transposase